MKWIKIEKGLEKPNENEEVLMADEHLERKIIAEYRGGFFVDKNSTPVRHKDYWMRITTEKEVMENFVIEKGVPFIGGKANRKNQCLYPFSKMEIGDSFTYTIKNGDDIKKARTRLSVAGCSWSKMNNTDCWFGTKIISMEQVRIWRIK